MNKRHKKKSSKSGQQQLSLHQAYAKAVEHFNCQNYHEAAKICSAIIQAVPNNIDAINLLGVIAQKLNRHDLAVMEFRRAINIDSSKYMLFYNIGRSLHHLGSVDEAMQNLKTALSMEPENIQIKNFLQSISNSSTSNSEHDTAIVNAEQALQKGVDFHHAKQFDQAIKCYEKVLEIRPNDAATISNIGTALQSMGKLDEAVSSYKKAIKIKPDYAMAYSNLGNILAEQGRVEEAITHYKKAIKIKPDYSLAYFNLGNAQKIQGKLDAASKSYQKAIEIKPDYAESYNNIGNILKEQNRIDEAIACYKNAIKFKPDYAEGYNNLGTALQENGQLDESVPNYQKAITIQPNYAEAYNNLGNAIKEQGKLEEAVACYKKAIKIKPGFIEAHNNLIFCTDLFTDVDSDLFQTERKIWADRHAKPLKAFWPTFNNTPNPTRKLRIGYVSSDFRHHSAAYIFGPVLLHHDSNNFQIFCYAGNQIEDDMSKQFKQVAQRWVCTYNMDDSELAKEIIKDGIDILVDLAGHTKGSRLLTFARKPSPIQITAWGYPHGTCMEAMDYLFADPIFIPQSERNKYIEKIIDLPCAVHLNSATSFTAIKELPYNKTGYITFGAFNRIEKYNEAVYRVWAEILHKIPTAKLLIKTVKLDYAKRVEEIHNCFLKHDIDKSRIILLGKTSKEEHQETYNTVDITLDPFPHNGGMTTLESLRMGVPVLTCENRTRCPTSASILHVVGLDEWRAKSEKEYVDKAVEFANNISSLETLRHELRSRFDKSLLWDGNLYTKAVETIYRRLWEKWCILKGQQQPTNSDDHLNDG
ncbi:MAG: tetratricopeptide repeat protein [Magnetococcales bacterium]|nr:tetratricopeptide repeat protein [Magnetococcales bacterium]